MTTSEMIYIIFRDTDRYLLLTGGSGPQASSSLVYDPAVDLWTPVTLSSSDPGPDPDWRPSRAAVHKDAVYFLGNRSTPQKGILRQKLIAVTFLEMVKLAKTSSK